MPGQVKCIDKDCDERIPADTERPQYIVLATNHPIRPAARCPRCREAYEKVRLQTRNPKGGLKMAVALISAVMFFAASGCASRGPWPFASEAQLEKYLLKEGMTVEECTKKKGDPLREAHYNPRCPESYVALAPDFSGVAYYLIEGSISHEAAYFQAGRVVRIKYVRAPWAGYDTWQRHELTWNKD